MNIAEAWVLQQTGPGALAPASHQEPAQAAEISEPPGECRKSHGEMEKPRWDLLPLAEVEEIVQVLTFGAQKYEAHNWKRGARWGRYFAALQRHLVAWWLGEEKDPETGFSHLAHAGCCLLFLMAYSRNGWGADDRCSGPDGKTFVKGDGL